MDKPMIIALILIAVIAIILIMSVTHISAKCDEISSNIKKLVDLKEKEDRK
ncbi:MAG: hypothetical protein K5898_03435 [Ruminococcus sp.]|uniref:hypothetical protein n=1 Tax=Ruminococcus sp. TaxID=41978 RepID=UPI0025E308C1|nr:hypothetical protein [Ruminococcus sp.]MCR4794220.1 hypothetical protein [Ruminococcus sp.]